jgi:hypothetical protein
MAGQGDSGALAVTLEAAGEAPEDPQEEPAAAVSAPSVDADANGELAVTLEAAGEAPEDPQEETAAALPAAARLGALAVADVEGEMEAAGAAPEDTQEETAAALPAAARLGALAVADVEGERGHTHLLNPLNDRRHFNPALFQDDVEYEVLTSIVLDGDEVRYAP